MKTNKNRDIFHLLTRLEKVLREKPSPGQILKEVQMMKFKIRPLVGDISLLNFKDWRLLEALWSLGKLDDFFEREIGGVSKEEKKTFFQVVEQIRGKLETQLANIHFKKRTQTPQVIEMEIFKDSPRKKN